MALRTPASGTAAYYSRFVPKQNGTRLVLRGASHGGDLASLAQLAQPWPGWLAGLAGWLAWLAWPGPGGPAGVQVAHIWRHRATGRRAPFEIAAAGVTSPPRGRRPPPSLQPAGSGHPGAEAAGRRGAPGAAAARGAAEARRESAAASAGSRGECRAAASRCSRRRAAGARVCASLRGVAVVKSDYAARLETKRKRNTTCGRLSSNLLVSIAEYRPYTVQKPAKRGRPAETVQAEGRFFAFHPSSYKPGALGRQSEDVDHYKHGTFKHGEWFKNGGRCAGSGHNCPLPERCGARRGAAELPRVRAALGCARRRAHAVCAGHFHQAAEWRSKTAAWAIAARAVAPPPEPNEPRPRTKPSRPPSSPRRRRSPWWRRRVRIVTKLVERHGKGLYDALGNMPNQVLTATLTDLSNELDPSTRALVRYLAVQAAPTPRRATAGASAASSGLPIRQVLQVHGARRRQPRRLRATSFIGLCPERQGIPMHMTCNPHLLPNSNPYLSQTRTLTLTLTLT